MRFHQAKDLIDWAAGYHRVLAKQHASLARGDVGERVRMALEYLVEREHKLAAGLTHYLEHSGDHSPVLDTWFDDPDDFPHPPVLQRFPERIDCDSVQGVLATALTAHRTLQDLYAHRVELAAGSDERAFFESLAKGHDAEVRRLSRNMQRLEDL